MRTVPHDAPDGPTPPAVHPDVDPRVDPHTAARHHREMVDAEHAVVSAAKNVAELLMKYVEHGPLPAGVAEKDVYEKLTAFDQALYNAHMLIDPTEERPVFFRLPDADQAGGSPEPLHPSQTNQPPLSPWPPHYHGEGPSGPDHRIITPPQAPPPAPPPASGPSKPPPEPLPPIVDPDKDGPSGGRPGAARPKK
jgi:hypothetical protein